MTDIDRLYAAILAVPEGDTLRLVWADAIEERGEPGDAERAAFTRKQIAASRGEPLEQMELWHLLHHSREWWSSALDGLQISRTRWAIEHTGDVYFEQKHGPNLLWIRRGFGDEIRLPLAAFCGGPCERCGDYDTADNWIDHPRLRGCKACDGNGRTEGLAGPLFAAHPITRVMTDRRPLCQHERYRQARGEKSILIEWSESDNAETLANPAFADYIPSCLWSHPLISSVNRRGERIARRFKTEEAAHAALSAACVALGRQRAGLAPLA